MALGIYKPGQGYWVRVLTATAVGIVSLATALYLYQQMGVVASKLPRTLWTVTVTAPQGEAKAGDHVVLMGRPEKSTEQKEIGTAEVAEYTSVNGLLRLKSVNMTVASADPGVADSVSTGPGAAAFSARIKPKSAQGEPTIRPELLQGGVAAIMIVIGAALAFYLTAMHQRFVEFLIATDMEMKKVNWSTRRDIVKSTMVVIFASVLISASLFAVDYVFQLGFRAIGVLTY